MVEGVALEMLCRLLSTEGSNPSLSVLKLNHPHTRLRNIIFEGLFCYADAAPRRRSPRKGGRRAHYFLGKDSEAALYCLLLAE